MYEVAANGAAGVEPGVHMIDGVAHAGIEFVTRHASGVVYMNLHELDAFSDAIYAAVCKLEEAYDDGEADLHAEYKVVCR